MRQPLEKEIKILLKKNTSKQAIFKMLVTATNRTELTHLLNNLPLEERRNKSFFVTLILLILLALLTTKQFLFVFLHESSNVSLILGLIGPMIHIFIIRELLLSHRVAYQLLPLLSVLALFRPENRILPDMYMYLCMAVLSGILYFFLFPKKELIQFQTH